MSLNQTEGNAEQYNSKFASWDTVASMRVRPRRILTLEEARTRPLFPPELVPVVFHEKVRQLGPEAIRTILTQRLYQYLDFTEILEVKTINPVLAWLTVDDGFPSLPPPMVMDGRKIYSDEGYHAWFSADLREQVRMATGEDAAVSAKPRFLARLDELVAGVPPELKELSTLFFAIVSETLISAVLADIPIDRRLPTAVRDVVADHAADEGRHHAYFAALLDFVWPRLSTGERNVTGALVPQFILAFLEPDYGRLRAAITRCGVSEADADSVISDSYSQNTVLASARLAAKATMRYFEKVGAFEEVAIARAFGRSGLVG